MFTGLIEAIGIVRDVRLYGRANELVLERPAAFSQVKLGDSIAINGVCLTVSQQSLSQLSFDVMPETLHKTNLSELRRGSYVNLERALALGDRLGGHLVSGHIDGVGEIIGRRSEGNAVVFTVKAPQEVRAYLVRKGSIAIDGISLTIGDLTPEGFWVSIIPHTLAVTALQYLQSGDRVNLEADIIGKYVVAYLERRKTTQGISMDFLRENGF